MAKSTLLLNQVTTIAVAPVWAQAKGIGHTNQPQQTFEIEVGGIGTVVATVVIVGSNDSPSAATPNPVTLATVTVTAVAADVQVGTGYTTLSSSFERYGALVTGLTGTAPKVNVTMAY